MSMYKVGDIVKIRDDLVPGMTYPTENTQATGLSFVKEMTEYLGLECMITKVTIEFDRVLYDIQEDHGDCWWCSSMFEGLADDVDSTKDLSVNLDCLIGGGDL